MVGVRRLELLTPCKGDALPTELNALSKIYINPNIFLCQILCFNNLISVFKNLFKLYTILEKERSFEPWKSKLFKM